MGIFERTLTIKRVATVLSNYQEEDGCGRNCLGKCCLLGSRLPLYTFKTDDKDIKEEQANSLHEEPSLSFLNDLLLGQWEDRMRQGLFRYDVTLSETKIIPGQYGFIAQLNEGRHLKKRPTEFRVDQVLQSFDENKFNFTKAGKEEALFMFGESDDDMTRYILSAPVMSELDSPNVVAINVSPIDYGHVLLIPHIFHCLPQQIDRESFLVALHFAKEANNPSFRVGYNSLGAFATINHLHFQAYYLQVPFPIEKAKTRRTTAANGIHSNGVVISQLMDYPVRGLVFEGGHSIRDLSNAVASSCIVLQNNNIPFNVLISGCGNRIFLFPQCYAEKQALGQVSQELLETQVNPAVWEISGHMVLKRRQDYENASEEYAWKLLSEVSLSEERFEEVKAMAMEASLLPEADMVAYEEPRQPGPQHFMKDCAVLH